MDETQSIRYENIFSNIDNNLSVQDGKIRTLQTEVYALKQENESLHARYDSLAERIGYLTRDYMAHSHSHDNA